MAFYGKRGVDMTINGEPDKNTERTEPADDDDILELTDEIIDTSQNDEEIIDLTDTVEEISNEPDEDDEIIELIAEPGDTPQEIEEIGESIFPSNDPLTESDDIPDLDSDLFEETIDVDEELDPEVPVDPLLKDDFAGSLGIELETGEEIQEGSLEADEQIDAALERVIKKIFYEKIDGILVGVIEETVKREIKRLRNILLEEESGSEK